MSYIPWIEKYKPTSFEAFKSNNVILNNFDDNLNNFNHCILYGLPGCGKTTFINLLTKKLYKKEDLQNCVLSLNASDERGINTVRKKIKTFAKQTNYKKYKFKIIILDEADSLTYEAQTALRRIIEVYSHNTRFCFICNYENKIINPIKSRCSFIKFNNFSDEYIYNYLNDILKKEKLSNFEKYINIILKLSKNDLRKSIIYLETLSKLNDDININDIYNMFGLLNKTELLENIKNIKKFNDVVNIVEIYKSYSLNDILNNLTEILSEIDFEEEKKYDFLILLSEIDNIKNQNVNYEIILYKLFNFFLL